VNRPPAPPRPGSAALTFLGATGTVTGSRFLVETAGTRVLVDCGLYQGLKELRLRNWDPFPVDPSAIDAVVVTHAHVDHVGYLPRLCTAGFQGPVLCTPSTADLAAIVLPDSGHLQEEEATFANRVGSSRHRPALPLYTEADARSSLDRLQAVDFDRPHDIAPGVRLTLRPAGHILGSACVRLELTDSGRSVLFSGDLGRPDHPLLVPPRPPQEDDVIVMESTYGGRHHEESAAEEELGAAITRTAERGGTVLIPAFAVDRTEVVLMALRRLMASGSAPRLPVYVDSPMALRALEVYRRSIHRGAVDVRPELQDGTDVFDTGDLHEVFDVEGSKALATMPYPAIIVSASGMATGGRVLHHLARLLPDPHNTVLLVGYQAVGTRGRQLVDGAHQLKVFGSYVPARAEVVNLAAFSVHADHGELLRWLGTADPAPATTYLVHGELEAATALERGIEADLGLLAVQPTFGERVLIG
jgi:metallo-beta-lactamase family protein